MARGVQSAALMGAKRGDMAMAAPRCGRYEARFAQSPQDLDRARALRRLAFRTARGLGDAGGWDADDLDAICRHVLIVDRRGDEVVACFRLLPLTSGGEIGKTYSARHYDLTALAGYGEPMVEIGRFCLHPDRHDPDILRAAWAALTRFVDNHRAGMLFGCSSFAGANVNAHREAFAQLRANHLAPRRWLPRVKAPIVYQYALQLAGVSPDPAKALRAMPPLLRSYIGMGAWVSDHAVIDNELNTLHVFTGLEIAAIPQARVRALHDLLA